MGHQQQRRRRCASGRRGGECTHHDDETSAASAHEPLDVRATAAAAVDSGMPRSGRRWRQRSATAAAAAAAAAVLLSCCAAPALLASAFVPDRSSTAVVGRTASPFPALHSVRKRRPDHTADGQYAPHGKIELNSVDVLASTEKSVHRKKKTVRVAAPRNPMQNQFRPRHIAHLEIVTAEEEAALARLRAGGTTTNDRKPEEQTPENDEAKSSKEEVDVRIAELLNDDDDDDGDDDGDHHHHHGGGGSVEQLRGQKISTGSKRERSFPDGSAEAANEIADVKTYSKLSDVAKFRARDAMSKSNTSKDGGATLSSAVSPKKKRAVPTTKQKQQKQKRRLTVQSVQETGRDTISESYTKSFTNHELLSREAEALLGKEIQILVRWEERRLELEAELLGAPTFAQWADAVGTTVPTLKKQIRKSQRAKAALIEANLRLVVTSARQTVKKNRGDSSEVTFHDACQDGIIGLTRATEKFDPTKDFRFSTYALWWIKGEIHRSLTDSSRPIRIPASARRKINDLRINERVLMTELGRKPTDEEVAEKSGLTLKQLAFFRSRAQDVVSIDQKLVANGGKGSQAGGDSAKKVTEVGDLVADAGPSPTDIASKAMLKEDVRRLVKTLSPREQVVIRMRFGLDDGSPKSLDDIGKKFRVETDRVRQIEARALLKLRQPYRSQAVESYVPDL